MKNVAVFASGNGSNFQALVDAVKNSQLEANICLLISDRPGAYAVERARAAGIKTFTFNPKEYFTKEAYEKVIAEKLSGVNIDWLVLAGYMRLIGPVLLSDYEGRIVNIHPSMLPDYPGKDAIGQALAAKVDRTGVTVHYVDEGMDTGPVIAQVEVPIKEWDTAESLHTKIQDVEHRLYPSVLQSLINKQGE
ncbi:phosphoribosylglycinamide formyltransferase [Neobacillus notoginsengisoli]|uniref:Phosphoribosylglycinamide formyltransferase n=1 Tax=Neobacillus notoginsengisoli TaxID=1578198 RepID=A0A417YE71_9BACI|nr:phosphoribosylglycinamide formyltransferase [Neobacillus notoginsengisoli]RHW30935.1 phosphoribosylglycinamide formyltransferase [Neobacillus notoginsengisoli]